MERSDDRDHSMERSLVRKRPFSACGVCDRELIRRSPIHMKQHKPRRFPPQRTQEERGGASFRSEAREGECRVCSAVPAARSNASPPAFLRSALGRREVELFFVQPHTRERAESTAQPRQHEATQVPRRFPPQRTQEERGGLFVQTSHTCRSAQSRSVSGLPLRCAQLERHAGAERQRPHLGQRSASSQPAGAHNRRR
jgi:hypothetical protein